MSRKNIFFLFLAVISLSLLCMLFVWVMTSREGFNTMIPIKKKLDIKDMDNPNPALLNKHCVIILHLALDEDKLLSVQVELNKMIRAFGNQAIIGRGDYGNMDVGSDMISRNGEKLFRGYKIKIAREIVPEQEESYIQVITAKNNIKVKDAINTEETPYKIVRSLIKFLGIQSDYV